MEYTRDNRKFNYAHLPGEGYRLKDVEIASSDVELNDRNATEIEESKAASEVEIYAAEGENRASIES